MTLETCKLCNQDTTPWVHVNGHICQDCYANTKRLWSGTESVWIDVRDKLPDHQQIILVFAKTQRGVDGYGVATFVDSIKMNEELRKTPYANECVDILKNPYFFCSQEIRQHTFNNVSHWMFLPDAPK